uniref:Retinoblastoma-like 1 (p107) n=1 Tax=Astatotilapia calliptera TaxID=8154 RepID=A0AAX7SF33_ASTCA
MDKSRKGYFLKTQTHSYKYNGDVVHWLACSLYSACRKGSTPTVGKGLMEGNCVSLTRILRSSKLSLIQFFSKMRKWADMSKLSQDFRLRMERLERNFEVSTVIFRKFEPIFMDMFQNPQGTDPPRQPRSRKHRRLPCHISDVFKFCWTLFVYTKGNFRMIGDDLVNSYHLLLCCLDLVFGNALLCANRKDLINPTFRGLPAAYRADGHISSDEPPPCVLERLCELHDGLVVEAKGIKQHYFKPYIQKLFQKQILKGHDELLTELLDPQNFIDNNKAINREYEEYVLTVGDFDERVFLGADADEEIGTPRKIVQEPPASQQLQQHVEKSASLAPSTPLTGRVYLKEKDLLVTPVSSATQSVSRLQSMVAGLRTAPSDHLMQIFKSVFFLLFICLCRTTAPVKGCPNFRLVLYCTYLEHENSERNTFKLEEKDYFAENRLKLAEILYYKILENVMVQETRRLPGRDMSVLLEQDIFHCSLMACCLEVVLFAYSSQRTFPWIISVFKQVPFYFFKVIEVFIRSEEGLSRDMVKHLNSIEEQVLECRAWTTDSALWNVPPSPLSVHDRYSSPAAGSAKRRLFGDDPPAPSPGLNAGLSPMSSPAKRLTFGTSSTLKIAGQGTQTTVLSIPLPGAYTLHHSCFTVVMVASSVYHLASVRLRDLCVKLDISSDLRGKIWTCFEHSLVHCTDLMKDRHLDQLLLCSIYIISKITKDTHTFQDIMKCYRSQPQANSHVRNPFNTTLLCDTPPAITGYAPVVTCLQGNDIIAWVNVCSCLTWLCRFLQADAPPLSPFPSVRAQPLSPRRISQRHSLYVSPHKNSAGCLTPNSYTYRINSSPSKELSDINRMIRQGCVSRKRAFNMEGDVMMSSACDSPSKRACPENGSSPDVLLKRLQDVVSERQSH